MKHLLQQLMKIVDHAKHNIKRCNIFTIYQATFRGKQVPLLEKAHRKTTKGAPLTSQTDILSKSS